MRSRFPTLLMRSYSLVVLLGIAMLAPGCATTQSKANSATQTRTIPSQTAEIGCATCIYDMKDVTGCVLAVKIDGTPYLVTGSDIDDHGDAHAGDGLCNTARQADIEGTIDQGRFVATKIELRP